MTAASSGLSSFRNNSPANSQKLTNATENSFKHKGQCLRLCLCFSFGWFAMKSLAQCWYGRLWSAASLVNSASAAIIDQTCNAAFECKKKKQTQPLTHGVYVTPNWDYSHSQWETYSAQWHSEMFIKVNIKRDPVKGQSRRKGIDGLLVTSSHYVLHPTS